MANRLLATLENPFAVGGHTVRVTASIGVAVADGSTSDPDALLRDADHAMVQAKRDGRERAVLFSSSMRPRTSIGGIEQLRVALDDEQFRLVYQPVVSSFDGSIVGLEALLRWDHPTSDSCHPATSSLSSRSPGSSSTSAPGCSASRAVKPPSGRTRSRSSARRVTVNVSARQLAEPDFRQTVASALAAAGLRPPLLCLELTEGTLLLDTVAAWARLREVKLLGVRLALDDFGTGFSSLSFVRQFSVDMIKIDRSFVQGVTMNAEDRAIVAAVAGLANGLGLACVAEGRRDEGAGDRAPGSRLCAAAGPLHGSARRPRAHPGAARGRDRASWLRRAGARRRHCGRAPDVTTVR